jgi:chemotaxis family two-component system sensor histidine kinase/response regulator PixL
MNILIVDDDIFFQNLISIDLLKSGHTVTFADDGRQAISKLVQNSKVDAIICDVNMPVLTGPSFILSLKQIYPKKIPAIIIVSATKDGEAFMNKIDIPHDYYFEKPVNAAGLNNALTAVSQRFS